MPRPARPRSRTAIAAAKRAAAAAAGKRTAQQAAAKARADAARKLAARVAKKAKPRTAAKSAPKRSAKYRAAPEQKPKPKPKARPKQTPKPAQARPQGSKRIKQQVKRQVKSDAKEQVKEQVKEAAQPNSGGNNGAQSEMPSAAGCTKTSSCSIHTNQPDRITGYTTHGLHQAIGRNDGRGVNIGKMVDAMNNPKSVTHEEASRGVGWKFTGRGKKRAMVVFNEQDKVLTAMGTSRGVNPGKRSARPSWMHVRCSMNRKIQRLGGGGEMNDSETKRPAWFSGGSRLYRLLFELTESSPLLHAIAASSDAPTEGEADEMIDFLSSVLLQEGFVGDWEITSLGDGIESLIDIVNDAIPEGWTESGR
ncbi:hypothetical protein ACFV98_06065 [Streptomyces violascens]|uniref:hypothetical protein n=1 Tax=Streptomyces violascens TaxID=67381 RepID=UPI00366A09F7